MSLEDRFAEDRLLTPEELAAKLVVPRSWIYNRIHTNSLPIRYLKIGKYLRFRLSDVVAYLETTNGRNR